MDFKYKYAKNGYVSADMRQEYENDYSGQRILCPLQEYENLKKKNDDLQKNKRKNRHGEVIEDSAAMAAVKDAMKDITNFYLEPMSMNETGMKDQLKSLSELYSALIRSCDKYTGRLFISKNSRYYLVKDIRRNAKKDLSQLERTAYGLFNRALKMDRDELSAQQFLYGDRTSIGLDDETFNDVNRSIYSSQFSRKETLNGATNTIKSGAMRESVDPNGISIPDQSNMDIINTNINRNIDTDINTNNYRDSNLISDYKPNDISEIKTTKDKKFASNAKSDNRPLWANVLEAMHTTCFELTVNDNTIIEEQKNTDHPVTKITVERPQKSLENPGAKNPRFSKGLILEDVMLSNFNQDLKESITKYFKKGANKNVPLINDLEKYIEDANFFLTKLLDPSKYDNEHALWINNGGNNQRYPEAPQNRNIKQNQKYTKKRQAIDQRDIYITAQNKLIESCSQNNVSDVKALLQTSFWEKHELFKRNFNGYCRDYLKKCCPGNELDSKLEIFDSDNFQKVMWEYFSEYYKRQKQNEKIATDAGLKSQANLTQRNAVMYHLAKLFGIGNLVTPATNVKYKFPQQKAQSGVLITPPTGISIGNYAEQKKTNPTLSPGCLLQLNTLQIFDLICGIKNRPINDILLNISPNTNQAISIQSIHNEASFGNLTLANNRNTDSSNLILDNGISIKRIDRNFYDRLMSIDKNMISMRLAGVIEPEYMNALLNRFEQVKNAIDTAIKNGGSKILVYPSELNQPANIREGYIIRQNERKTTTSRQGNERTTIFLEESMNPVDDTAAFAEQNNTYVNKMLNYSIPKPVRISNASDSVNF